MFFDNISFNGNFINDNNNLTNDDKNDLFNISDAFMLGNSFKSEFMGYKNYKVNHLSSNSEKGKLLLKIYEYDFAINDLSLYLDLHPEDQSMYNYFRKCTEKLRELVNTYEENYGPLDLCESDYENYEWVKGKWPFEGVDL